MTTRLALTALLLLLSAPISDAQTRIPSSHRSAALQHARAVVDTVSGLEYVVTDAVPSTQTGLSLVYLRQQVGGIEVIGTERTVAVAPSGRIAHSTSTGRVAPTLTFRGVPPSSISASEAVSRLAQHNRIPAGAFSPVQEERTPDRRTTLTKGGAALESPTARLVWILDSPEAPLTLTWEALLVQKDRAHAWLGYVDAQSGHVHRQSDLVVRDAFGRSGVEHQEQGHHAPASLSPLIPLVSSQPLASASSYTVYPMPVESPLYAVAPAPADGRQVVTNPEDPAGSPWGWHDTDGIPGAEFTTTEGNNARVYTDIDNDNLPDPNSAADGGAGLSFAFPLDLTQSPTTYSDASVTNLFYWNNVVHDVMYLYGFDSPAGNFQVNTYGLGGVGGDAVEVQAQDGYGFNNALFYTPPDGQQPFMVVFLGNNTTPYTDGAFDNLVTVHEYGHGITNRLTGGPSQPGCLGNAEQMGEGWSDWYGLMFTMDANDTASDARNVGNYLFGQTATGPGVRLAPYSTSFAVNDYTYGRTTAMTGVHQVGFAWATILWEMTWDLIQAYGFDPDLYYWDGPSGNQIAMRLVTEALKLQPCGPGFVTARDAILAADQLIYGGAHVPLLQAAFARRGLGYSASQGSSNSVVDNVEAFDLWPQANVPPTASFIPSCSGLTCTFTDTSTDSDGTVTGLQWDLGDGTTSTAPTVTHTYNATGTFFVSLTATDDGGATDTATRNVQIQESGTPIALSGEVRIPRNTARQARVRLTWTPADGGRVSVYRDGVQLRRTRDDGVFNDKTIALGATYQYQVCETDTSRCSDVVTVSVASSEEALTGFGEPSGVESGVDVFPNPLRNTATVRYGMAESGEARMVVYNSIGQQVAVLASGHHAAGQHEATFDASALPAGVYVYRLEAGGQVQSGRLSVVR